MKGYKVFMPYVGIYSLTYYSLDDIKRVREEIKEHNRDNRIYFPDSEYKIIEVEE